MMELYFSSDHHFYHENIIKYCNRPFKNAQEMNEYLVEQHNKYVKPQDHWYCLGDVTMRRDGHGAGLDICRRLQGHKRLILGNHDHYKMQHYLQHFEKVMAMNRLDDIWFTHVPVHPENLGSVVANCHGHIHENPSPKPILRGFKKWAGGSEKTFVEQWVPYINLSVDVTDFHPVSFEEVKQMVRLAVETAERNE